MKKITEAFTFSIIGYGRLGKTLAKQLQLIGGECKYIISRKPSAITDFHPFTQLVPISAIGGIDYLGQYCFICVPDDHISMVAKSVDTSLINCSRSDFIHTSGAKSSSLLDVLQKKGCRIATFHPMQTFTGEDHKDVFENILVSLEGDNSLSLDLYDIATSMGCKPIVVNEQDKIRLHIAGVMVSNFIFSLVIEASKVVIPLAEFPEEFIRQVYGPLMKKTINNIIDHGVSKSLTGPASRGDVNSIEVHKRILERDDHNKMLYEIMTDTISEFVNK